MMEIPPTIYYCEGVSECVVACINSLCTTRMRLGWLEISRICRFYDVEDPFVIRFAEQLKDFATRSDARALDLIGFAYHFRMIETQTDDDLDLIEWMCGLRERRLAGMYLSVQRRGSQGQYSSVKFFRCGLHAQSWRAKAELTSVHLWSQTLATLSRSNAMLLSSGFTAQTPHV